MEASQGKIITNFGFEGFQAFNQKLKNIQELSG